MAASKTPQSAEHSAIIHCLSRIRRRLWSVRLVERLIIALQWSAGLSLFLTGAYLLRNPLPWENLPWAALLLILTPVGTATWLFHRADRFAFLGLSKNLVRLAAIATVVLALGMLGLLFWPGGGRGPIIEVWMVPAGTIIAFAVLALATVRMVSFRAAAIYVDRQVGLHERVSTALELLETPVKSELETPFRTPVITSALGACREVQTAKVGYGRLNSRNYALAALIAVVAASVTLIPPMPARAVNVRKPNTIIVKKAQDLHELLKELEEKQPPNDKTTQNALKPLQNAVTKLQEGNMSQIESSAVLNEAKLELKREQEQMAASDKAADAMKSMSQTKDFGKAAEGMKSAERQKGDGAAAAEQQKAAGDAMKAAAQAMADKMASGQMSEGDKKELADQLQEAANKAAGDPQLQKSLQDAANAARSGNAPQMSQAMQSAGQRMAQQAAASQGSQSAINRAMAEIDKMQGGGEGSQSTMAQGGQQGGQQGGEQGGSEGDQGDSGGQNGNQANSGNGQSQQGNGAGSSGRVDKQQGGQGNSGDGSTMLEARGGPDRIQGQPLGGKGTFVRIYEASATETKGNQEKVGSFINPLKSPAVGTAEVFGPADRNDASIKTYKDVLPEARQQAMDELTRQEYPPQYQEMVRQFYNDAPKK